MSKRQSAGTLPYEFHLILLMTKYSAGEQLEIQIILELPAGHNINILSPHHKYIINYISRAYDGTSHLKDLLYQVVSREIYKSFPANMSRRLHQLHN